MVGLTLLPREDSVSVGVTSVEVSPETGSKQRQAIVLTNTSAGGQVISLAWGRDAVAGKGITLLAGEHHVEAIDKGFIPLNARISAIADAAGGTLAIHERLIEVGV